MRKLKTDQQLDLAVGQLQKSLNALYERAYELHKEIRARSYLKPRSLFDPASKRLKSAVDLILIAVEQVEEIKIPME